MADKATIDAELEVCAGSLTAFTKEHGGVFVLIYVGPDGAPHEASDATDRQRALIGDYLRYPMGNPENRRAGRHIG